VPKSLGTLVAGFKSSATGRINAWCGTSGQTVWQRNYWEHVIRNEKELAYLREYIQNNPLQWELDQLHPAYEAKNP
jgi:REP element-mobilizing transposase RayT